MQILDAALAGELGQSQEPAAPQKQPEKGLSLQVNGKKVACALYEGDEKPFAESHIIPEEPDWQKADGLTVLFLDKDGYVIDREMQTTIEDYMRSWRSSMTAEAWRKPRGSSRRMRGIGSRLRRF